MNIILETTNPHCFIYKEDELLIELLGSLRIDTLDRMRVIMKVTVINRKHTEYLNNTELEGLSVKHNFDLYNDTQVEIFLISPRIIKERFDRGWYQFGAGFCARLPCEKVADTGRYFHIDFVKL